MLQQIPTVVNRVVLSVCSAPEAVFMVVMVSRNVSITVFRVVMLLCSVVFSSRSVSSLLNTGRLSSNAI